MAYWCALKKIFPVEAEDTLNSYGMRVSAGNRNDEVNNSYEILN